MTVKIPFQLRGEKEKMINQEVLTPSSNDPIMLNKHNVEVRVPEGKVAELLKKGFTLLDPNWRSDDEPKKPGPPRNPDAPMSRYKIEETLSEELDSLEVETI